MTDTCKKCGRPSSSDDALITPYYYCAAESVNGDETCAIVAAAYRRGLRRSVEIAKKHAGIAWCSELDAGIFWGDVDRVVDEEVARG